MATKHVDNLLTRERILVFVLVAASALVGWLCWLMVEPFVPAVTWAVVLAVIAHPLHERILARMPGWPNFAAFLALVAVTVVIALPSAWLVREVVRDAIASADSVRGLFDGERWKQTIHQFPQLAPLHAWFDQQIDSGAQAARASEGVTGNVQSAIRAVVELAVTVMVTFFLLFFFLRDKWRILAATERLVPLADVETAQVVHKVRDMIGAVVYGTLVVAIVQGFLGGLMFWWLSLPGPLLWGAMMALVAVLPFLGAAIVWLPAVAFLLLDGHWEKALILFLWGSIVIGLIDNFLYPLLMKDRLQMHTVPVFIAAMGGLFVFGTTGIVLGPLILAVAIALLDIWRRRMELREVVTGVNDNAPR
jgi:predicted PurR-regulated permease PerM